MGQYERSIRIALDKISGEILEADEVFDIKKDAFSLRRQFHKNEVELYCCECEQKLNVSTSKYDRLHFKHQPNADYCILKDGNLTPAQIEQFNRIFLAKESPRHKELKNKIAERLLNVEGIDISSIAIDNKCIIRGNEKRRPDVYCKYYDKELVFEIQLSDLSLRYILSRYEFYKEHGLYLIWILDNFDIHNQGQLERDIKYLTKYENFFKMDEGAEDFRLNCKYKFPFLTEDNKLLTKWLDKSVSLSQISFDPECYQIYYYDFGGNRAKIEEEKKRKDEDFIKDQEKRSAEKILSRATQKSYDIIQDIKNLRIRKSLSFDSVKRQIEELNIYELEILNSIINLRNRGERKTIALHYWISSATNDDIDFIEFILSCIQIDFDVNEKDSAGKTAFQVVSQTKLMRKWHIIKALLKRGYIFTSEDENYLKSVSKIDEDTKSKLFFYMFCNMLSNRSLVDAVLDHLKLLLILESARKNKIIGSKFKETEWIAFANNAIQYYSEYWEYIEVAFKNYGLWDKLIQMDRKGTFQKKVQSFYLKMPQQKFDFEEVFRDLFVELTI